MGSVICSANERKKRKEKKDDETNNSNEEEEIESNIEEEEENNNNDKEEINSDNDKDILPFKNGLNASNKNNSKDESKIEDSSTSPTKVVINTNLLVSRGTSNIKNNYKKLKIIGRGSFGKVYLVKNKLLNNLFAMKIINKTDDNEKEEDIMNEINILRKMDHPNIVKIHDFYTTLKEYILVTEYCPEGELFYEIKNYAPFNEALAGWYMKQIISAISYCHKLRIIHRDLKPENILISSKNKSGFNTIKIIDFGTAIFNKNKIDNNITGSIYYIAPEVISKNRNYSEKCDVWSCGIIMYILLTGLPPFNGNSDKDILRKIMDGYFDMKKYPWPIISSLAKDLIKKLLEFDPNKRITAEEALNHPWFECSQVKSQDNEGLFDVKNPDRLLNNLINFKSDNVLRSTVFAYLIHNNIQLNQVHDAINLFNNIDKNGDGQITRDELYKGFKKFLNISGEDLQEKTNIIFNNIDADHNGYIEYEEFIRAAVDKEYFLSDTFLRFAFDYFDRDKNGVISFSEVKQLFYQNRKNKHNSEAQKQLLKNFEDMDINGDGVLSFEEFVKMSKKIINSQ